MSVIIQLASRSKNVSGKQIGSSMIEVLIALFIMAIGLMAVQAMQLSSLRTNVAAAMAAEVQMLASDMAERILAYDNIADLTDNNDYAGIDTINPSSDPACGVGGCSGALQKVRDTHFWKKEIENRLPGGRGQVASDNAGIYTITVMWDNDKTGANGTGCGGNNTVDLSCYRLQINM